MHGRKDARNTGVYRRHKSTISQRRKLRVAFIVTCKTARGRARTGTCARAVLQCCRRRCNSRRE